MRRARELVLIGLLLVCATAGAGEREWRDLRKAYDEALSKVESDRGRDPAESKKAFDALRAAADKLKGESQPKTVEHLLAHGFGSAKRPVAELALDVLKRIDDAKAQKDLLKAFEDAQGAQKLLLFEAVRQSAAPEATLAFVKLLRDRDEAVRVAAARALGARGADARATAEPPLTKALKDESRLVRLAAARSLETLTGKRPEGFAEPQLGPLGLLDKYPVDRVAIIIDSSLAMAERAFVDPTPADGAKPADEAKPAEEAKPADAPADGATPPADGAKPADGAPPPGEQPKKPRRGGEEPAKKPEPPKPVSPHDLAVKAVKGFLKGLGDGTSVHLVRFGGPGSARSYQDGWAALAGKVGDEAAAWVERAPTERGRDVLLALRRAMEQTPPPQMIHVFLAGGPEGRGVVATADLGDAIKDLRWGKDVTIDVTAFTLPPEKEPTDERGRQARSEAEGAYHAYVDKLAEAGGGRATRIALTRLVEEKAGPAAPAGPAPEKFPVDLTKPVASRDLTTVKNAVRDALAKADAAAETFIEEVAACPDRKAATLALDALRAESHGLRQAAVRGLTKNADPAVHEGLIEALKAERDPGQQLLLLRACGRAAPPGVTAGIVDVLGALGPDAARLAWSLLAQRPAPELAAQQGRLVRAARGLTGLADFHAKTALAAAAGQAPPAPTGLVTTEGAFLPDRFVESGVAFIVDSHRDMDAVFWAPPPPPEKKDEADKPRPEKPQRGGRNAKPEAPAKPEEQPRPVTRLGATVQEVQRALKAAGQGGAKANVITTGGRSWQGQAAALDERQVESARAFAAGVETGASRDVWKALKQALEDPAVEVVHLLVSGVPVRSSGPTDGAELLRAVRGLNRDRGVQIHVTYVLGPAGAPDDGGAAAARRDLLTAMDGVYRTLCEESGGRLLIRETLTALTLPPAPAAPAAPPGK